MELESLASVVRWLRQNEGTLLGQADLVERASTAKPETKPLATQAQLMRKQARALGRAAELIQTWHADNKPALTIVELRDVLTQAIVEAGV